MCQRAHGAAFVTWVGFDSSRVEVDQPYLRWFSSSQDAERGFCDTCGSSMFFRSSNWPGELHISLANIDDPLDREPAAHGYYETHVQWYEPNDHLPKKA